MCVAVPLELTQIDGATGWVRVGGATREVSLVLLEDVHVGDYVLVHAGFAIHKMDDAEAEESLRMFRAAGL